MPSDNVNRVLDFEEKRVVRGVMLRAEEFIESDTPAHKAIKGALWDWLDLLVLRVKKAIDNDVPDKSNGHAVPTESRATGK